MQRLALAQALPQALAPPPLALALHRNRTLHLSLVDALAHYPPPPAPPPPARPPH